MMAEKITIVMPRLNANDDSGILAVWLRPAGSAVRAGELIAQIETTKAAVDIEAHQDGYLHPLVEIGATVVVGEPIAWLVARYDAAALAKDAAALRKPGGPGTSAGSRIVSRKAQEMMAALGIPEAEIPGDGPIGVHDVESYAAGREDRAASPDLIGSLPVSENAVVLFGAADQGIVVIDDLLAGGRYTPVCFVDERPKSAETCGLPVFRAGALADLKRRGFKLAHICIGNPVAKLRVADELKVQGFTLIQVIHPKAIVSPSARLGEGVYIGPGVVIGPSAIVGDYCQVNNNATVPHHVKLGRGVRISDGANIAGGVSVGDRAYLGLGVTVNTGCHIGEDATLVSGVSVFEPVAKGATVRPPRSRI